MRKISLALIASTTLAASASLAADLPGRAPAAAPAPIFAAVNWTGFYVGAQAGYAWNEIKQAGTTNSARPDGAFGGLHLGYNWQSGALVLGVEGDAELSGVSHKFASGDKIEEKYRASLRLRAGYAFDKALLYVTGGVAGHEAKLTFPGSGSSSKTAYGWTVGAGLEYALTQNWSVRGEYRYTDFGNSTFTIARTSMRLSSVDHAVRLGVSYRFGGPAGAVVAKY